MSESMYLEQFVQCSWEKADDSDTIVPSLRRCGAVARTTKKKNVSSHMLRLYQYSASFYELLGVDDHLSIPRVAICELHAII